MGNSLVLLPTYNERQNLPQIVPRLALVEDLDVLVIDDSSPDGTGDIAEELCSRFPRLSVLHRRRKEGLGRAYVHGFEEALRRGYRRVVTMDADLSHAPEDVPRLLEALQHADVAIGSRHAPGGGVEDWPLSRRLLSRTGSLYARALLRLPLSDVTSGFRAYRAEALSELELCELRSHGFVFQVEVLRRLLDLPGTRAVEVPILFRNRLEGRSKLTGRIIFEAVGEIGRLALQGRRGAPAGRRGAQLKESSLPPVTVIVPTREARGEPKSVGALRVLSYPPGRLEVLVTRGRTPSAQRNAAVRRAGGEYLLFLDDDSACTRDLLKLYISSFLRHPSLGAVGGPAVSEGGGAVERACAAVFSELWVVGKVASRYRPRGGERLTDERELILCNLCVRREAFEAAGGFDERLYPNEENEFLERLKRLGWGLLYRPDARVGRPQRKSLGELCLSAYHYGSGRGGQGRISCSRVTAHRVGLSLLALACAGASLAGVLSGEFLLALPALLYLVYLVAVGGKLFFREGARTAALGTLLTLLTQSAYAGGVIGGSLRLSRCRKSRITVERRGKR